MVTKIQVTKIHTEQIIIHENKVAWFLPRMGVSYFPKREFLVKPDQYCFGATIVYDYATSFRKNPDRADNKNKVS